VKREQSKLFRPLDAICDGAQSSSWRAWKVTNVSADSEPEDPEHKQSAQLRRDRHRKHRDTECIQEDPAWKVVSLCDATKRQTTYSGIVASRVRTDAATAKWSNESDGRS
jgi:hypothetical protein